ncbi:MAG: sodium:calcium antiporter [Candidatus Woesearchaeota archaeon]
MVIISQNPVDNVIIGVIAIVFLVFVADKVVMKTIKISKKLGISQIFIGLTVIAIGTSLPEITTSVVASMEILRGNIDPFIASSTVLGTNIGSDIVQQTLILGIVGLFAVMRLKALRVKKEFLKEDGVVLILAAILLLLFASDGKLSRIEGAVMFFGYIVFLWFLWMREDKDIHRHHTRVDLDGNDKKAIFLDIIHIIMGIVIVIFSAGYVLRVASFFVTRYEIGGSLIGILAIGVATALPELTTSITAMFRGASSISIGTLIGSNITNPMFAVGLGAMISSYQVPRPVIVFDIPVKIITSLIVLFFLWRKKMLTRNEAGILIAIYFTYILVRLRYFAVDI